MKPKKHERGATTQPLAYKMLVIRNNKRTWVWQNGKDAVDYASREAAEDALT